MIELPDYDMSTVEENPKQLVTRITYQPTTSLPFTHLCKQTQQLLRGFASDVEQALLLHILGWFAMGQCGPHDVNVQTAVAPGLYQPVVLWAFAAHQMNLLHTKLALQMATVAADRSRDCMRNTRSLVAAASGRVGLQRKCLVIA